MAVVPLPYAPEHGAAALALVRPWSQGCIETVETLTKIMKQKQAVATILSRYQRRRNCQVPATATDVYADTIARVCGDDVDLDPVERGLIHLKRHKVISGRRLVTLLARYQRLCCTNSVGDSSRESRVVAGMHEQTHPPTYRT
ncbi:hypothetical protein, partial [Rhodovulum sulfidophilum]|uniref:hypothetical protein n=1 Tax=Rhodovulum sulfidophilum TaxID=35806 RepID=UPI001C4B8747